MNYRLIKLFVLLIVCILYLLIKSNETNLQTARVLANTLDNQKELIESAQPTWLFSVDGLSINPKQPIRIRNAYGRVVLVFIKKDLDHYYFKSPLSPYEVKTSRENVEKSTYRVVSPSDHDYKYYAGLFFDSFISQPE